MKPRNTLIWISLLPLISVVLSHAQPLNLDGTVAAPSVERGEREYFSEIFNTEVVTNVSVATLTPHLPDPAHANGVGVIIAPGGGFHALSINSEGNDVAAWLNQRGIAAFVLRYRLVPGGEDAVAEMLAKSDTERTEAMAKVAPLAGEDGLSALRFVRYNAASFNVDPDKVGIIGFSAGGAVTLHVAHHYQPSSRPAFVAPIYAAARWLDDVPLPEDAPPLFVLAASDDQLGLAGDSIGIYQKWLAADKPAELHMYARGGHGFGMHKNGAPSDSWIERFGDWLADWQR